MSTSTVYAKATDTIGGSGIYLGFFDAELHSDLIARMLSLTDTRAIANIVQHARNLSRSL